LDEKKLNMKRGTIVDATLIAAPSSTKNKDKSRDPEMSSTTAKTHDKVEMEKLLHGKERAVFGDKC